jgi:hypothetical protein
MLLNTAYAGMDFTHFCGSDKAMEVPIFKSTSEAFDWADKIGYSSVLKNEMLKKMRFLGGFKNLSIKQQNYLQTQWKFYAVAISVMDNNKKHGYEDVGADFYAGSYPLNKGYIYVCNGGSG